MSSLARDSQTLVWVFLVRGQMQGCPVPGGWGCLPYRGHVVLVHLRLVTSRAGFGPVAYKVACLCVCPSCMPVELEKLQDGQGPRATQSNKKMLCHPGGTGLSPQPPGR